MHGLFHLFLAMSGFVFHNFLYQVSAVSDPGLNRRDFFA
jgi:hypothetical protein